MEGVDKKSFNEMRRFDDYEQKLGDALRGKRAETGKSLIEIEEELGLRRYMIVAIENCDPPAFENPNFIPSHVRTYAKYLGLDPESVYEQFCEECSFSLPSSSLARPSLSDSEGLFVLGSNSLFWENKSRPVFSLSATTVLSSMVMLSLVGGALFFGFSLLKEFQQISSASPEFEPMIEYAEDSLTPTYFLEPQSSFNENSFDERFAGEFTTLEPIGDLEPGELGVLARADDLSDDRSQEDPEERIVAVVEAVPQIVEPPKPRNEVKIFAALPAWVRVRSADDTILLEKILETGETYLVPKVEGEITLRAGNSGSVYFDIDGHLFGPAGRKTSVVKNLVLDAASLRSKYEMADESSLPKKTQALLVAARISEDEN